MSERKAAAYGSWRSPITSELAASGTQLMEIMVDGDDVYWRELRPTERGRHVVMRAAKGRTEEVTPPPFNVRTLVHEYGGGAFLVADGIVYFSNYADQRLYRQRVGDQPQAITPVAKLRYADGVIDRHRRRIICVREDHSVTARETVNTLVSLHLDGGDEGDVLVSGNDFYSSPRLSPDGSHLAWLTWNHPNMPWDASELWVGELRADGSLGSTERMAGGSDESILQPEWSPDGFLHFVSDRTDWWNLYRCRDNQVESICAVDAEFGGPSWSFGFSSYGFQSVQRVLCAYNRLGTWQLAELDLSSRKLEPIKSPYSDITYLRCAPNRAVFLGGSPTEPESIVQFNLTTRQFEVLYRSRELRVDTGYISTPRAIEFPTSNNLTAHAFFYLPKNHDFSAPTEELPPLIVIAHGGPTSAARTTLNMGVQFWTSRGLAVLDVNYGGSTGYGRAYRRRLYGQWGIVDVDDCAHGAEYLAKRKEVDGRRLAIRGGSAGGYTTLCALTFRDVFKAGASHFGISDLEVFDKETHKFESRYNLTLIGPYPKRRDLYRERSPIHFIDRISSPVILFQGLEDKIVPPIQAELIVKALRSKGMLVAYIPFEGEQHGFRRTENIKRALEAELYFYSKVFRFEPADPLEPIKIDNF